jgi:hypothetical protein
MLVHLVKASKVAGLAYSLLSTTVLIGLVVYETAKYVRRERKQ